MHKNEIKKAQESTSDFLRIVWPEISPLLGGGEILAIENFNNISRKEKINLLLRTVNEEYRAILKDYARFVDTTTFERTIRSLLVVVKRIAYPQRVIDILLHWLDVYAGVDFLQLTKDHHVRGIASRVQRGWSNYKTFTLRYWKKSGHATEIAKRVISEDKEYLRPGVTVQAYLNKEGTDLVRVGVVRTKDLYRLYNTNPDLFSYKKTKKGDAGFLYIAFDKTKGCRWKEKGLWHFCNYVEEATA